MEYCLNCDKEVEVTVRTVPEVLAVKGEPFSVVSSIAYCNCCGEPVWVDELEEGNLINAFAAYRDKHGLLHPTDIRRIRERYGMTAEAFSVALGLDREAIAHYERGSLQSEEENAVIAAADVPEDFLLMLIRNTAVTV